MEERRKYIGPVVVHVLFFRAGKVTDKLGLSYKPCQIGLAKAVTINTLRAAELNQLNDATVLRLHICIYNRKEKGNTQV